MLTYGDLQLKVIGVLQDAAGDLGSEEQDRLIQEAVRRYCRVEPRVIVEDETGDGTRDLAVSLLASWVEGLSVIKQVEYPVTATDVEPPVLEQDEWRMYQTPAGKVLRFLKDVPTAAQTVRITYTTLHTADETGLTIPETDFDAVANWGASLCLRSLAHRYAQSAEPTIGADSVRHDSLSERYARRARELWKDVANNLGISEDETAAGTVIAEWPAGTSFGFDWLTHERRRR
jgi:hypothetical protein